jgi:hypothetical protein
MKAPGFTSAALAGGYELDPDLPVPESARDGVHAGLHTLRHLVRFVESLGLELVLTGDEDSELWCYLAADYDEDTEDEEYGRYRKVTSPSGIRRLLRTEPRAVPLFWMSGSSCVGWGDITWEGMPLDPHLKPGRLFALLPRKAEMKVSANRPIQLHLLAWQSMFPTHSLVTWGIDAHLCDGPQELDRHMRDAAAWMFHHGSPLSTWRQVVPDPDAWWHRASAVDTDAGLAPRH